MGYILKYYRNHNLFLVCVISSRGNYKSLNCTSDDDFGVCLHIFNQQLPKSDYKSL
jgi:hypothetical protein